MSAGHPMYDVTRDDQRFVMFKAVGGGELVLVQDFFDELGERVGGPLMSRRALLITVLVTFLVAIASVGGFLTWRSASGARHRGYGPQLGGRPTSHSSRSRSRRAPI